MGEPTPPKFGAIPEAPSGNYRIEEGAAAGVAVHLQAEDLARIERCHICGARAGMGKDGRLRMEHDSAKHFTMAKGVDAGVVMAQPVKREDDPADRWWDS